MKQNLAYYEKALAKARGVTRCRKFESIIDNTVERYDFSDDTYSDESSDEEEEEDDSSVENDEDDDSENDAEEEDDEEEPIKKRKKWRFMTLWLEKSVFLLNKCWRKKFEFQICIFLNI